MKTNISLEEAQTLLLALAKPVKEGYVSLFDATGRVLSQDIQAGQDLPPFAKSPLDGYALQAKDTEKVAQLGSVKLSVIEEIRAGYLPAKKVTSGTASKVMTGAPVPAGADVIIKYEAVERNGDYITISDILNAGSNIIQAGEDIKKGETVAYKNNLLSPSLIGLFAGIGLSKVPVFNKVRVAILSTGDELLDPAQELQPGKIYNSNLHSLRALCLKLGTEPIAFGIVADKQAVTAERISQALMVSDIVITTGGASVGDYDVVLDALKQMAANIIFWKVDMKPGSPVIAAEKNNKLIIALSGNPAAALITFNLIVVPLLKKMMGLACQLPLRISAVFADNFPKQSPQRRFLRGRIYRQDEKNYIKLTGEQSNGILKSMITCNALIDIPANSGPLCVGQKVSAVLVGNIDERTAAVLPGL
ncbi:gephyrin-like molybdotransferase Glp [Sporomusa termitida]|uniref:Molybdopterin molybdenumtransferase n=1 Tax=Sporomusa termitida TaxID=2377 RepID=A0A517DVS2_9FIRM|nr:gephyrin-like molybdotransferase Glp [Sporomusa termitida]QDR81441.1 Molybdopterin molybdenumtransferase [Sporomusa termitida]